MNGQLKFAAIQALGEVAKATNKFPTWPTDPIHAAAVLHEEVGELAKAVLQCTYEPHKSNRHEVRKEAIQTAAMALRFLMSLDLYEYKPGTQHKQDSVTDSDLSWEDFER